MRSLRRPGSRRRNATRWNRCRRRSGSCHSPSGLRKDSCDPRRKSFCSAMGNRDPRRKSFCSATGNRDLHRKSFCSAKGSRDPRRRCFCSATGTRDLRYWRFSHSKKIAVRNPVLCRSADSRALRHSALDWRNRRFDRIPDNFDCYSCPCEFSSRAQTRNCAAGVSIFCIIIAFETNNFVVIL